MITAKTALIIQVVDDAESPIIGKEVARIASKFIPTTVGDMRYIVSNGYIDRKPGNSERTGGYAVTEKGAKALLEFERTVKSFLDNPTH